MSLLKIGLMQIRIRFVQEQNLLNINGMKKIEVENVFMFNSKININDSNYYRPFAPHRAGVEKG